MSIKNYTIEDVGIGLGLCTDKDFIPVSYSEGKELAKHLRRTIPQNTKTITYEHPHGGLIEILREDAIKILETLDNIF